MIRHYLHLCRFFHRIKHLDEHSLYCRLRDSLPSSLPPCPSCSAPSSYSRSGSYNRHLVCYSKGSVCPHRVSVLCLACPSCKKSHAFLPSIIIPYSSFSLGFLISLLYGRLTRRFPSVLSLCEHFGISESTYYRIRKRFTMDSKLLMDLVCSFLKVTDLIDSLHCLNPLLLHSSLDLFFRHVGYSFLQPRIRLRPRIPIHSFPPGFCRIS